MSSRLAVLREVAAALGSASSEAEVAAAVLDSVSHHLDAVTASLWLPTPDGAGLAMAYERDAHPDAKARFAVIPVGADLPGSHVFRTGQACFVTSRAERDRLWPLVAGTPSPSEAIVVLPLQTESGRLGVCSFGWATRRYFDHDERLALLAVADHCAIALDRARRYEAARADADANHLLARVSAAVSDYEDWTLIARHAVEACIDGFVDTCVIYVREGHLVRRAAGASRRYAHLVEDIVDRYPTQLTATATNATVVRTGEPRQLPPITESVLHAASPAPEYLTRLREVRFGDGWVLPLQDGETTFGAMLFAVAPDEHLDEPARTLAGQIARRVGDLLRSATAFAHHRAAVEALHEVLVPAETPVVEGFDVAACYVPYSGSAALAVGGDWWDALALPSGNIGVVIGDVAGHGVPTAAVTGQVRNTMRTCLIGGASPAGALDEVSRMLDWTHPTAHATAVIVVVDPVTSAFTWASAGHPPPLVVDADGGTRYLTSTPMPPLGIIPGTHRGYRDHTDALARGATLFLYTDGLVEGRACDLDTGLAALAAAAPATVDADLQAGCERLVARLVRRQEDDICLVGLRHQPG